MTQKLDSRTGFSDGLTVVGLTHVGGAVQQCSHGMTERKRPQRNSLLGERSKFQKAECPVFEFVWRGKALVNSFMQRQLLILLRPDDSPKTDFANGIEGAVGIRPVCKVNSVCNGHG
jgi:hypothetical protein